MSKFFDSELLKDAMDAFHDADIRGKLYRLVFMLNKDTKIQVKAGVGMTETAETNENVSQGTNDSSLVSSSNISKGVNEVF